MAMVIAALFVASGRFFATHWIQSKGIPPATVHAVVVLMGLGIAIRWPSNVYSGVLGGLQKQVVNNFIFIGSTTLRSVGAVLVLWLVSPTVIAFFLWQLAVVCLQTLSYYIVTKMTLPKSKIFARFDPRLIKQLWKFAAGMAGINICTTILYQLDKIVLSKLIPLQDFGYYALAANIAYAIVGIIFPITGAIFPRFSQLFAAKNELALKTLYHQTCQLVSLVILPIGVTITLFSNEILVAWTQNTDIASHSKGILSLLAVGIMLNAIMAVPYYLQVASGWTKLLLYFNCGAVVLYIPILLISIHHWNAIGAASAWTLLNLCYILVVIYLMHKRILQSERNKWLFIDVGIPLCVSFTIGTICRICLPSFESTPAIIGKITGIFIFILATSIVATPSFWSSWRFRLLPNAMKTGGIPRYHNAGE
jgi:O-antigen/teichoic acid export membrane protein